MIAMRTAREIIQAIGIQRFQDMLAVGPKSVARAIAKNSLTASWLRAIDLELRDRDFPGISEQEMDLFSFKERIMPESS